MGRLRPSRDSQVFRLTVGHAAIEDVDSNTSSALLIEAYRQFALPERFPVMEKSTHLTEQSRTEIFQAN
jgi:hypothetical protein